MLSEWVSLALAPDGSHLLANFNQTASSALMYNLFADKLCKLNAVPDAVSVVDGTTPFYADCGLLQVYNAQSIFLTSESCSSAMRSLRLSHLITYCLIVSQFSSWITANQLRPPSQSIRYASR